MKTHNGDVHIKNKSDIQKLKGIEYITGNLSIYNVSLSNLSGLESLKKVGGYLYIWNNDALTSLTGLTNIASVGRDLWIAYNGALTSLTGLDNLTSVGGDLWINRNPTLKTIEFPYSDKLFDILNKGNILKKRNINNNKHLILEKNLDKLKLFCFNDKTIFEIDKYKLLEYKTL